MDNVEKLRDIVAIQTQNGNWDYDSYMFGMANALLLALAIVEDKDPKFLDAPDRWLANDIVTLSGHRINKGTLK